MNDTIGVERNPTGFAGRLLRAIRLDRSLYREAAEDRGALGQAMAIVVIACIAAAFGSSIGLEKNFLVWALTTFIGWSIWAFTIYLLGTRVFFPGFRKDVPRDIFRVLGFASAPGIFKALGAIPGLTIIVFVAAELWTLIAATLAVKETFRTNSLVRSVFIVLAGWVAQVVLTAALVLTFKTLRM
jgi:hypothetical protein